MLKPHPTSDPTSDYGLGLFELHADSNCSGTILINHNGSVQGYATLMYSTPDGSRTLAASLTYVDDAAQSLAGAYQKAVQTLTKLEFCGGQAGSANGAEPAQSTGPSTLDRDALRADSF
jgi:D-alanyl-D-alanine carboxypeptidase